jgi:hypothetical protein
MGDRGMSLRDKIIAELQAELGYAGLPHERAADRILAISEIAEALAYVEAVDSAHPVFNEIREMLNRKNLTHRISTAEPD